ncbi:MAG: hypothetical protein VX699_09125, partial [Myxococcota bacterium]|nr:hypothetical protein [Myxococcota bacterium]
AGGITAKEIFSGVHTEKFGVAVVSGELLATLSAPTAGASGGGAGLKTGLGVIFPAACLVGAAVALLVTGGAA